MDTARKPFRIEETLDLLVGYTGNGHLNAATYQRFLDRWAERLSGGRRFGVILVYEEHDHDDEHNHDARDAAEENKMTRAIGDFRRTYREQVGGRCTGFSRVFPEAWLTGMDEEKARQYEEKTYRLAEYMFGVRGKNFTSLAEAKGWLASVSGETPLDLVQSAPESLAQNSSTTTGLYYGSTTGITEDVAEKLQGFAELAGVPLQPVNISDLNDPQEFLEYDQLILGIPTWNVGQLQDDWLMLFPNLDKLDFSGKQVALFGVGDQVGYPDNFLDAMGMLGQKLTERGANLVGFWPTEGYAFTASKAQVGNQFMGLGLDDYNQEELTDERIAGWLRQIQQEFGVAKREAVSV